MLRKRRESVQEGREQEGGEEGGGREERRGGGGRREVWLTTALGSGAVLISVSSPAGRVCPSPEEPGKFSSILPSEHSSFLNMSLVSELSEFLALEIQSTFPSDNVHLKIWEVFWFLTSDL